MKKKILVLATILIVAIGGIAGLLLFNKDTPSTQTTDEKTVSLEQGMNLSYKQPLVEQTLSDQDKEDKFILRLASQEPAMLVSVRYEDGLRAVAAISKQELLPMLLGNADKSFPQRYADYSKKQERQFELAGKKAAEIVFTYKGPSGDVAKQRLVIIIKDENTAIYISAQAQEINFDQLSNQYFESLINSVTFGS